MSPGLDQIRNLHLYLRNTRTFLNIIHILLILKTGGLALQPKTSLVAFNKIDVAPPTKTEDGKVVVGR